MSATAVYIENDDLGRTVSLLQEEIVASRVFPWLRTFSARFMGNDPQIEVTGDAYNTIVVAVRIDGELTRNKLATLRSWATGGYELFVKPVYVDDDTISYTCILKPDILIDYINSGRYASGEIHQLIFEESTL
jgi:hypothetical protein